MKRRLASPWAGWLLALLACGGLGAALFAAAPPKVEAKIDDPVEGQKLAQEIRSAVPGEEVTFKGVLRLSAPKTEPRQIPLESKVVLHPGSWSAIYIARPASGPVEMLTVHHFPNQANAYEWSRGGAVEKFAGTGAAGTNRFAGSDFALLDLGLEFFHWPTQLLSTRMMRKSVGCDVLESRPARTNLYSRVLCWIAQESRAQGQPGTVFAEAYDASGKLLKEFEVTDFSRKIGQVTKMELRNRQTKTSTRLVFEPGQD